VQPGPLPPPSRGRLGRRRGTDSILSRAERLTGVAGLVLMLSPFMDWYTGSGDGLTIGVIGWHTGTLGKLVFFLGLAVVVIVLLREAGIVLPASVPESLVVVAVGALATIFVLIQLISIPDRFIPWDSRGIGVWIALASAIAVILCGVLQASEDL
jgi:hypothetical protein